MFGLSLQIWNLEQRPMIILNKYFGNVYHSVSPSEVLLEFFSWMGRVQKI